ncbi:MAG: radical SAM protein [Candidatus Eremiobacteraeota bacterium]|nr:radical SAM protein [Candidatus Eremiobacteraeota bacterium]
MAFFFKPYRADTIGLITTYRCPFSCRHCLYCSSPQREDEISNEALSTIISEASLALGEAGVHIGGGEPLLNEHMVEYAVKALNKTRLVLEYLETNGFPLRIDTEGRLQRLKAMGIPMLLLSISPFHNEFISAHEVERIFHSIIKVFGYEGIFPWHPGYFPFLRRVDPERPVPLEEYFGAFSPQEIRLQLESLIYLHPSGRAAYFFARYLPTFRAEHFFRHPCGEALKSPVHVHVDYRGAYLPGFCAGLSLGEGAAFQLEKLYGEGIDLALYPVLELIVREGLEGLYRHGLSQGYEPIAGGYVSACHLCIDLRIHLYNGGYRGAELYPRFFYDELSHQSLAARIGKASESLS